jgi:hypothetical protein
MSVIQKTAEIEAKFAKIYEIDLKALRKDAKALITYTKKIPGNINQSPPAITLLTSATIVFAPRLEADIDASAIPLDPRLLVRQIEANLDEAAKLVQACQMARERYGDLAKTRSDVKFKGEEFLRLDKVHQLEIDSGLYTLPWLEATDEVRGLEVAIKHASEQEAVIRELFGEPSAGRPFSSLLEEGRIRQNISDNAFITRNTANKNPDDVEVRATEAATFRGFIECAAWLERWNGISASLGQLKAKLEAGKRKAEYLHLDDGFKNQRRNINRDLALLQLQEHTEAGSELNYDERLKAYKAIYLANLLPLVERAMVIETGLRDHYGIDLAIGKLESGSILDRIAVWLIEVQDKTSKWRRTQRLTVTQFVSAVQVDSSGDVFTVDFDVNEAQLPIGSLLRGANFEFVGNQAIPVTIILTPPDDAAAGAHANPLQFGRVCPVAPNLDLRPQHVDLFWNRSGIGTWKIKGVCPGGAGAIQSLILYIWTLSS